MPALTDEDKVIRNDVGKRIAAAIEDLSAPEAEKVSYDNTESGMTADNAQDAIDELKSDIDSVELADLDDVNLTSPQDEDELHYDSATSKWKNIAKKIYEKSASGSLVSFNDGGDNIPLGSLIANITAVQSGSGTPSPSNIRAISGWSGINVFTSGKNLFDGTLYSGNYSDANFTLTSTTSTIQRSLKIWLPIGTFTIRFGNSADYRIIRRLVDGGFDNTSINNIHSYTFTTTQAGFVGLSFRREDSADWDNSNIQIELGSTGSTVEAYTGTQITLPFGQTVYGGTLNVLTGLLTVTHEIIDLGSVSWTRGDNSAGATYPHRWRTNALPSSYNIGGETTTYNCICSNYRGVKYQALATDPDGLINGLSDNVCSTEKRGYINIVDSAKDEYTSADFKTAMSGIQLVYELATPVTYQLTPAQVSTLLGLNNIFADTGDISLSYFTQNANAINDVAESNTRTALNTDVPKTDLTDIFVTGTKNNTGSTISAGTYFYVNNQLALCKSAISANADLTLNTNYELVTAGALNKLMSKSNPTGTGKLSINRKSGSNEGDYSTAIGRNCEASGEDGFATGYLTKATGYMSSCAGYQTEADHRSQLVFGEYNDADPSTTASNAKGRYIEMVGNGTSSTRSNARTLDWNGNETLAGDLVYQGDVSLSKILREYTLSSTEPLSINVSSYTTLIIIGFAQGIGAVAILVVITAGSIQSQINMATGATWSNSHLTFTDTSNVLKIQSDNANTSRFTIIRGS